MFLILAVVLIVLWLGGFLVLHISSFLIHLLISLPSSLSSCTS